MDTDNLIASDISSSAFPDLLQNENGGIKLYDILTWDMCPDIKIDSAIGNPPFYQFDAIDSVDYVKFESRLQHRNPRRGDICNKGIKSVILCKHVNRWNISRITKRFLDL
jgi:hypothetical protein